MWRAAVRPNAVPALAAALCLQTSSWIDSSSEPTATSNTARCEAGASSSTNTSSSSSSSSSASSSHHHHHSSERTEGFRPSEGDAFYHGLFPKRQLWHPKYDYPQWDRNWDGREPPLTDDKDKDRELWRHIRKEGVTRHIILIRHGQYDETHKDDEKRVLTPLGQQQAAETGKRLAKMMKGAQEDFGPCNIKVLRVSNMTRAKETADIIASYLPGVEVAGPNPDLNEGRPCHHIPGVKANQKTIDLTDQNHPRIERAFKQLFHRSDIPIATTKSTTSHDAQDEDTEHRGDPPEQHEFEVVICHANVIRYFMCRALQLPPEAWLRFCPFNCSLTYITIRATGAVSCRMVGDIGHLPYGMATFSKHHGFNW